MESAEAAYEKLEAEMVGSLVAEVEAAAGLAASGAHRRDPWLWDLEWKAASARSRSGRLVRQIYASRPELAALLCGQASGYPAWFQALFCTRLELSIIIMILILKTPGTGSGL
jgi:hypothetical protein